MVTDEQDNSLEHGELDEDAVSEESIDEVLDTAAANGDDPVEQLRGLVVWLVEHLVDEPQTVEVDADQRGSVVQIQVRLPEEDLGKMIGRGGRIAKSIRTALMIAGSRHHLRVSLDIEGQG
jgi:uncharacterized protein